MSIEQRLPQYVRDAAMPRETAWEIHHGLMAVRVSSVADPWSVTILANRVAESIGRAKPGPEVVVPLGWEDVKTIHAMTSAVIAMIRRNPGYADQYHVTVPGLIAIRGAMREYLTVMAQIRGMELN